VFRIVLQLLQLLKFIRAIHHIVTQHFPLLILANFSKLGLRLGLHMAWLLNDVVRILPDYFVFLGLD